jgi:hypothetical protein
VTSRGIAFVDATPIRVCHNRRISHHRTFKDIAQRGKDSVDWFYGFKLHLIVDDRGQLVTPGNVDEHQGLRKMAKFIKGKLLGDKGYLLLPKRSLIETINDQLKNISQLEHSRHRRLAGFMRNLVAALVA